MTWRRRSSSSLAIALLLGGCDQVFGLDPIEPVAPGAPFLELKGEDAFEAGQGDDITLTADLATLIWNHDENFYVSQRASAVAPWPASTVIAELDFPLRVTTPRLSPDAKTLFYAIERTRLSPTSQDIVMSTRATLDAPWSAPVDLPEVSSPGQDSCPAITADGLTLVLSRRVLGSTDVDVLLSQRASTLDAWDPPQPVPGLAEPVVVETDPFISADGREIYYTRVADGKGDLWVAFRTSVDEPFGAPAPVADVNRETFNEGDPWISPDGHHLFFMRDSNTAMASLMHATR